MTNTTYRFAVVDCAHNGGGLVSRHKTIEAAYKASLKRDRLMSNGTHCSIVGYGDTKIDDTFMGDPSYFEIETNDAYGSKEWVEVKKHYDRLPEWSTDLHYSTPCL